MKNPGQSDDLQSMHARTCEDWRGTFYFSGPAADSLCDGRLLFVPIVNYQLVEIFFTRPAAEQKTDCTRNRTPSGQGLTRTSTVVLRREC
jgi:hypothetical protein